MVYARVVSYLQNCLYMNGLSGALSLCKAGCYIDDQCMNHLMYADDICVMAPTAIALQKLLDVCYEYGITNDLIYNPLKSVCKNKNKKNKNEFITITETMMEIIHY